MALVKSDRSGLAGPQKAAVMMLALGEEHCRNLFGQMHEEEIKEISAAMAQLGAVRADLVEALCLEFAENIGAAGNLIGTFESTERLLMRTLPKDRALQVMEEIRGPAGRTMWDKLGNVNEAEERNREAAERIKALMFTFDDLQRLTPSAVQVLMRVVEKDKLPLALKGASETLRDLFFKNMSERAGKMLKDDIEALGPVKLRDVDDAQAGIVATAKELAASGEIEILESKDEEIVY